MRNNNRRNGRGLVIVFAVILTALVAVGLAAFLAPNGLNLSGTRSEREMAQDIMAEESTLSRKQLIVDKLSVTKRQTRREEHADRVWVDVTASNTFYTYTGSWALVYDQFNDGWELSSWKEEAHTLTPRESFTEANVIADLEADGFTNVEITNFDPKGENCEVKCAGIDSNGCYRTGGYIYTYSPERGWRQLGGMMVAQ